jgi:hypothetical protein
MSDPLSPDDTPAPGPRFDDAVRSAVEGLRESIEEFERLTSTVPDDGYTDGEWTVIENAAAEIESLIDAVQLEYHAAAYDSQAWYDIMQDLPRVTRLLGDAMLLMREAEARRTNS